MTLELPLREDSGFCRSHPLAATAAVLCFLFVVVIGLWSLAPAAGYTRLVIADADTGRKIFSTSLRDGEEAIMNWKNSLLALNVTETYQARNGVLVQDGVTFDDPRGLPPPEVAPSDVDDLYQTGGPFTARGLDRSFSRVAYRVSEIGNPTMRIRDRAVNFKNEVGFGGGVILTAAIPSRFEVFKDLLNTIQDHQR